ncbi:MAG: dihydroorotate dehydrogenase electron transfer subunit [Firmicutes bacterium]|nr:dihydroorotate dehydrogenase electron transfer subunit [Bacillota bacterium]
MHHQVLAIVKSHGAEIPGYYRLRLEAPAVANEARPGQFVMVRCSHTLDPLLRRPLTVCALYPESGQLELLYKVVGKGTRLLSEIPVGARVDVVGPLGNGYTLLPEAQTIAVVGRGVGVASVFGVAQAARAEGRRVFAFVSARTRDLLLRVKSLREMGCCVEVSTDDGSAGHCGLVTDLLRPKVGPEGIGEVFVCGSNRLTRAVAEVALENGISAQVSLEAHMACGVHACMGCVRLVGISGNQSYKKVCEDGPVFWVDEVVELTNAR